MYFLSISVLYLITVKPRYNVSLGTKIFQRYFEMNVISRESIGKGQKIATL